MDSIANFLNQTLPTIIADASALIALIWTIIQHYTKASK